MTSNEAGTILRGLRRDLVIAGVVRGATLAILAAGFTASIVWSDVPDPDAFLWAGTMTAVFVWIMLSFVSMRQLKAANHANLLIANGRLDLAEQQLIESMRAFSIYATSKLMACHNLAVVAHGRGDYAAAAELCGGVLRRGTRIRRPARRMTRILLADCKLCLGDPSEAGDALTGMTLHEPDMPLAERLLLLPVLLRHELATGAPARAVDNLREKVRLAERLDAPRAAFVHELLSRACEAVGKIDASQWLLRRAALYHDLDDLPARYSIRPDDPAERIDADSPRGDESDHASP
jgi:hypothetical protein